MSFAQPLIRFFGQEKTKEALHLAQGIWNASVMGAHGVAELRRQVGGAPKLLEVVESMIKRKQTHFAQERWEIDNLRITFDAQSNMKLRFDTFDQ